MSARDELAAALYRLEWQADLYATPRGSYQVVYERRADKLLAAGWVSPAEVARIKAEAWDEGARASRDIHGDLLDDNPYRARADRSGGEA